MGRGSSSFQHLKEPSSRAGEKERKQKPLCPRPQTHPPAPKRSQQESGAHPGSGAVSRGGTEQGAEQSPRDSSAPVWGHSAPVPRESRAGRDAGVWVRVRAQRVPPPRPPKPSCLSSLPHPSILPRRSPERGSKVTTKTATTWSSSTSPSSRRPGCSSTSWGAGSSGSRLRGASTATRPLPPPPRAHPPACSAGSCGTETAGPSAQRRSGAASPCSTMARRGGAKARGAGRAAGTPLRACRSSGFPRCRCPPGARWAWPHLPRPGLQATCLALEPGKRPARVRRPRPVRASALHFCMWVFLTLSVGCRTGIPSYIHLRMG